MAKSLRSKRKQKVKAVKREKYRQIDRKKCWEKHLALQAQKDEDKMVSEDAEGGNVEDSAPENPLNTAMETDRVPISRKKLLKMMKSREARRKNKSTKRLRGRSHSKW